MEKAAYFVADSQDVLRSFPIGPGVVELKVKYRGEYRVFYTVSLDDAVYVISAFRKKTQKTSKAEIDLAKARLAELKRALRRK